MLEQYKNDRLVVNVNLPEHTIDDLGDTFFVIPFSCEDVKSYETAADDLAPYIEKMKVIIADLLEKAKDSGESKLDFIKRSVNYILTEAFGDKGEVGDRLAIGRAFAYKGTDAYPIYAYVTHDSVTPKMFVGVTTYEDDAFVEFMFGYLNAPNLTTKDTRPLYMRIISAIKAAISGRSSITNKDTFLYDLIIAPLEIVDGVEEYVPAWIPSLVKQVVVVGNLDKDEPIIRSFNDAALNNKEALLTLFSTEE